ncbi:MAG: hypothetical protein ACE5GZ_05000 [Gammaproteobacteria bacterium]
MKPVQYSVPLRKTASGEHIDTRPLYIEEWLDSLPYIDFQKTSRLLYEATKATNRQPVKPAVRLELTRLYDRPYRYYLDSQISTGAQHTLQSIETMQAQINVMKLIAGNLGYGCKLAMEESLKQKTLWRQSKPPLPALLMSLNYLSHALIFSFLEYSPTPKNVWRELNRIYDFARDLGQENTIIVPIGGDPKKDATSISSAYKRIALASLVDPHHLPFGAIWEIFGQLGSWSDYAEIKALEKPARQSGYFVIDSESDSRPVPCAKFNIKTGHKKYSIIDTRALGGLVQKHIDIHKSGQALDDSVHLSSYFAGSILAQMSKAWGLPPKRYFPRKTREGTLELARGLHAIYFHLNNKQEFISANPPDDEHIVTDTDGFSGQMDITPVQSYHTEQWNMVDQGAGGLALLKHDKPKNAVRVGDLIGFAPSLKGSEQRPQWSLGVIRWLMVRQNRVYKIGIQMIAAQIVPAAIRALDGSFSDSQFQRAFIIGDPDTSGPNTIITGKGLFINDRELEISYQNKTFRACTDSLIESSLNFEHFNVS